MIGSVSMLVEGTLRVGDTGTWRIFSPCRSLSPSPRRIFRGVRA
jgi:hypothetical protein